MRINRNREISRRQLIQGGVAAVVALATHGAWAADARALPQIVKTIPSTGEKLPAVGVGTNAFGVNTPQELAEIKRVLQGLPELGGKVVDSARQYGSSEEVIGRLLGEIGNRDRIFLATKTPMTGSLAGGTAVLDESFRRLQVGKIDLLQIHNLNGVRDLYPALQEYKAAGKIRYVGITTSMDNQYAQLLDALKDNKFDFVQVDYSIGNRDAAEQILPFAQEKGMGVLINVPFGGRGRSFFPRLANVVVPDFAQEFDAGTWAQFMLKYIVSHPAVTATIPGTTTYAYLEDNQMGGRGKLPDAAMRKRMEDFWDKLPS
jgi:aryl-alcohol dehydrogenase-like predicted oxidoreductase